MLLIDEVDRVEIETEALLLEVLSDFQVSIPELGTIVGAQRPIVVLTSNNTRELSEALKRRCLYLHVDYPDLEREKEIVRVRVPEIDERARRADRPRRALDPRARPQEGAVDLGDDRLGPHAPRTSGTARSIARGDRRDPARAAQVPVRHRQGAQGARGPAIPPATRRDEQAASDRSRTETRGASTTDARRAPGVRARAAGGGAARCR